ncbi:UBN2 domain-containing protein [Cephalotus follicularis]|uniref:UBN2 domain-containing protein n=1 Tax=Cephalotus follicularis TaxID=3775 RepID=A0A1Q3CJR7_CEPFO|nr:UBN2 domain-containing protein [Cephalotus follicularis]
MNAKAKHIIICAINCNDFNRVSSCISAEEMWDRLEVTYQGSNKVKEDKISMFVHEYEMFTMHENEDIKSMFTRFTNITNALQTLDKVFTNSQMELLGSLMTHELSIKKRDNDEEKEKRKKKVIALKFFTNEKTEDDSDEELAIITRKFKRFYANKKKFGGKPYKKTHPQKGETSKLDEIICYECNELRHFKSDCPRLKKK